MKAKSEPRLQVRLKRFADGTAALSCTRADGSVIRQRQSGSRGLVFPPHDLTHFAVETVLASACGFYGLLSTGWEFGDFSAPWPRGPIPAEAREVELLVGSSKSSVGWAAVGRGAVAGAGGALFRCPKTRPRSRGAAAHEDEVERIHALLGDLLERWCATKPGETLELSL